MKLHERHLGPSRGLFVPLCNKGLQSLSCVFHVLAVRFNVKGNEMRKALLVLVVIALAVFEFIRNGAYEMGMTAIGAGLGIGLFLWLRKKGWLKTRQPGAPLER
jgi:hypothetical protein